MVVRTASEPMMCILVRHLYQELDGVKQDHVQRLTKVYTFRCCLTLTACYPSPQSILTISFALAKKVGWGEVGGFQDGVPCAWQLL